MARSLIDRGASVGIRSNDDLLPLQLAIAHEDCPSSFSNLLGDVNVKGKGGETALHVAARMQKATEVENLITKFGALVNVLNNDGETPLNPAPIHNPPASTAIFQTGANKKSDKDVKDELRVCQLLISQNFDGSFLFTEESQTERFFGKDLCAAINEIELNLHRISINKAEKYKIAVAIAVIVELEESFQSCKDLWLLIVEKARHFVDIWLGGFDKEGVFEFAEDLLTSKNLAREELGSNNQPLADRAEAQTRDSATTELADTTTLSTKSQTKPGDLYFVPSSVLDRQKDGLDRNSRSPIQNLTPDDGIFSSTLPKKSSWRLGRKIQSKFQSKFEKTKPREALAKSGRLVEGHSSEAVNPSLAPNVPISAFEKSVPYDTTPKPKATLPEVVKQRQSFGYGQDSSALVEL
ncbi:hypothetical protein N431DRAFT_465865 [Stipitochalara longipes BDJ]|nr:hypothetical protein N431DRAFT_465865 [Stipitochalara longipes BDJ]